NQRLHRETRARPDQRFLPEPLLPLPALLPDYRDTADALVHKGSAPPVRRQPLLRPSPLRRLPVDRQSRSPILDHLRPTSRSRHLSPLLAARPDTGDRALREGTARPTARRPSI